MASPRKHRLLCWSLVLAVGMLAALPAMAADVARLTLELKLGGSDLVNTSYPFKRVSIADPEIADVVVLSPRELYVYGKKVGYTSVILWEEGKGKTLLDVVVALDLTGLKEKLHLLFPDQKIEVYGSETGMVLAGTVSGPEIVEQVLRLARTYLPKQAKGEQAGEGTGRSGAGITNLLQVGGLQQVMLEVKVAEVTRASTKDWQAALGLADIGSKITGAAGVNSVLSSINLTSGGKFILPDGTLGSLVDGTVNGLIQNPGSLLLNFAGNDPNIFFKMNDVTAALHFLEGEGLARLLAEPRLVTQSGQEAKFLAGGEFPVPVPQGNGDITIQFKEFGVALVFTPVVMSDGRISLRVAPSVSDIASTQAFPIGSFPVGVIGAQFIVPNLTTRKLETTVQLQDGQTLALAGLLQDKLREQVDKIPGLGDLPVLGALFRSTKYQQEKTDLLVTVTPHLVKPVPAGSIRLPGEDLTPPRWYEFYLEGRLTGRSDANPGSGTSAARLPPAAGPTDRAGLEGEFGYQPVADR